MRKRIVLIGFPIIFLLLAAGCGNSESTRDTDISDHTTLAGENQDEHEEEVEIEVTADMMNLAGITLAKAGMGIITFSLDLSGEVGFNEDRLVHVTPRFSGIAQDIRFKAGDIVHEGDVLASIESNESLTNYVIKAPISGRIIEKHISRGEFVSQEKSITIIADLSTVWVNLAVYPKDASRIRPGNKVTLYAVGDNQAAEGTIQYMTSVINSRTRRITARVILPNLNNEWRPGTFVNATVEAGKSELSLVVEKNAVQILGDKTVVFVQHEPGWFKPVAVTVGESDSHFIQLLGGLEAGVVYVSEGAFEIKAKIVTSSLDGHAGHGH